MRIRGAYIREQNVTFAIVLVKQSVLHGAERERIRLGFAAHFKGAPVILAARGADHHMQYHGREDIVEFLAAIPVERIPWKDFMLYDM